MNKFLSIVVLATAAVASLSADHMGVMSSDRSGEKMNSHELVEHVLSFKNKVSGKTLEFPSSLVKEGMGLKAKMLRMAADSLRECGELNFKAGSAQAKQYDQAAEKAEALATALEGLPVNKTMKKTFDKVDEWIQFKIEKKQLKARFFKEIAKQLNDKEMEKKADKFASMVEKFKTKLEEESSEQSSEESSASEETEGTGCPVNNQTDNPGNPGSEEEATVILEEEQE
jgi:hypothetical protein